MINFFTDETKFIRIMRFAFIFIEMFTMIGVLPDYLSIIVFVSAIAGLLNIALIIKNNPKRLKNIFVYCWIYIIIMMLVSTYINKGFDFVLYIKYDLTVHFVWFSLYFLRNDKSKEQIKQEIVLFAKIFVLVTVFLSIISIIMSYYDIQFNFFGNTIAPKFVLNMDNKGIYGHHTLHGFLSSISTISSIYLILYTKKTYKILYTFSFVIECIMLYLSGCRNAQISLIIAIVFFISYVIKNKYCITLNYKVFLFLIPISLLLVISFSYIVMREFINNYSFSDYNYAKYSEVYQGEIPENYLSKEEWIINIISTGRYQIQKETLIMSLNSPIIGNGHFTLNENARATFPVFSNIAGSQIYPYDISNCHLFILQAFYETGVLGLLFTILITIKLVIITIKIFLKENVPFYGYLVSIGIISLIWGFLDTGIFFNGQLINSIIWLFIGALFYSYIMKKKRRD